MKKMGLVQSAGLKKASANSFKIDSAKCLVQNPKYIFRKKTEMSV